jgi:hypothetical protein
VRLVDLGPGEGRIAPEAHLLALCLLALDLGQQHFLPALRTVHVSGMSLAASQSPWSLNNSSG